MGGAGDDNLGFFGGEISSPPLSWSLKIWVLNFIGFVKVISQKSHFIFWPAPIFEFELLLKCNSFMVVLLVSSFADSDGGSMRVRFETGKIVIFTLKFWSEKLSCEPGFNFSSQNLSILERNFFLQMRWKSKPWCDTYFAIEFGNSYFLHWNEVNSCHLLVYFHDWNEWKKVTIQLFKSKSQYRT